MGVSFFKIIEWSVVSGSPPLLDIIVAQPLDEASNDVRPNGSSHLDGTTAISDLFKNSIKTKVNHNKDITIEGLIKISKLIK